MRFFNPRGSAIFLALIMMIGALAILMGVLASSTNNVVKHDQYTGREATYFAAEGVISQVWGKLYNPIAKQLYTDQGIYGYLASGTDTSSPYRGSFQMPCSIGDPNDINTTSASVMESNWVALPNLDVPAGYPVVAYTNAGFKFGNAYIVDVVGRWRRDVLVSTAGVKTTIWTITIRATTQNRIDPAKPGWYDENDPPAIVAQTFQFKQSNSSTVLNYVNLARNVSCTLCHTQFQDVINAFNNDAIAKITDPGNNNTNSAATTVANNLKNNYGKYPKIKLGTLGNFQVRDLSTDPVQNGRYYPSDSLLDGTLYSRGIMQDNEHNALSSMPVAAMQARQFDSTMPDNIYQDNTGAMNTVPMVNSGYAADGNPVAHGNMYLNYPNSSTVNTISGGTMVQTDGVMPDDFPYPFDPNVPDTLPGYTAAQLAAATTNRLVDGPKVDNWIKNRTDPAAIADAANPNRLGTMKGGYAMVVDGSGNIISAPKVSGSYQTIVNDSKLADPGSATETRLNPSESAAVGGASGIVNGNLVLVGTKDNPVNLSSQVLVKGDVIIKGYYTGVGSMWATGNIYLPSDLRYRDQAMKDAAGNPILDKTGMAVEDFGNLNNMGSGENLGGMIAGGTIVIGDYLTSSLSSAPMQSNYTLNLPPDTNVRDSISFPLVPTYQKADSTFTYNYRDLNTTNGTYTVTPTPLFAKNFTLSQLELFNRDEWGHTQPLLPNGNTGAFDAPNAQYGQFDPVKGTYDSTKPYMPRYYVLNPGDPVGAFVYGSQAPVTNSLQMATDASKRSGTEGSYWSNGTATEPPMWKGGEKSKAYDTTTIGGDASQGVNGSIVNGVATKLQYPSSGTKNILTDSSDVTNTQKAAVIAINPQWLGATPDKSTQTMWSILLNEEWDRKFHTPQSQAVYASSSDPSPALSARDGQPFRLDGLFYTNNAIFGIQRNRALAPQAAGDYQDKSGPITSGPQAPDPSKPGPWPTPVPDVTYQYDNYQGNVVYDTYSSTLFTDHYRRTPYTDNYTEPKYTDNYTQPASYDTYSQTPYTDNYTQTQYYDTYSVTPLTDNYSQTQSFDNYSRTAYTDNFTKLMYTDVYVRTPYTDNYSRTPYTDNYTQAVSTVTWLVYTGTGYSRVGPFSVVQVSPPGTISQPTTYGGAPVTQASSSTATSSNTSVSAAYYVSTAPPAVPAGFTKTGTTPGTVQTSASAAYYSVGAPPAVPATYTKTGTATGANQTSASAQYAAGAQPAVPATYTLQSTSSTTVTSVSAVYYNSAAHPAVPSGYTLASTTTGATTTTKSANYTTSAPAVPAGYTKTSTGTTTTTSTSAVYYAPSTGPAVPAGWTKVSTTTGTVTTSKSANYTTTAPSVPANAVKTGTVTTTVTSTSAVYYNLASPPAVPAGWTKVSTTTGTTVTSKSANYTTVAPAVPVNFTKTGTVSTTNTSTSVAYYNLAAPPTVPVGFTKSSTTTTNITTVSATYYNTAAPPSVPAGYTKTSTTTGSVQQVASGTYRTGSQPAMPGGYSMDTSSYGPTGTTSATTTTKTANYMQGTTPPAVPASYIASEKTGTVPGSPATATIQVPYGSAAPAGYPTKLAPTNPTYAYPATTAGANAKDFKQYAKEMASSSEGVMVVNGALVAPDLGLLVTGRANAKHPKTLIMNYDQRVRRLVQFTANSADPKWNLVIKGWTRLNPPQSVN